MDRPDRLKSSVWKRAEQKVMAAKRMWEKWPLLVRLLLVAVVITLSGYLSPQCRIGEVRVCLCNLAHGTAWALCIIGGPVYALSAFVGLAFSSADSGLLLTHGGVVVVAALAAVANALASYFAKKHHQRIDKLANLGQLLSFVFFFVLLPVLLICAGFEMYIRYCGVQMTLPECPLRLRMIIQGLMSILLGDIVGFVLFQALNKLNEIKVYIFIRSLIFVSLSLFFMTLLYNAQSEAEAKGESERVQTQASNVASVLEHQIALQLRSISDLEYVADAYWFKWADKQTLQDYFQTAVSQDNPWDFVDIYLVNSSSEIARPRPDLKDGKPVVSSTEEEGEIQTFDLRFRYNVASQTSETCNSYQRLVYHIGEDIPQDSMLGQLLSQTEVAEQGSKSTLQSRFLLVQEGDTLQVFSPCYAKGKLVGIVLVGLPMRHFIARSLANYNVSGSGVSVCPTSANGKGSPVQSAYFEHNFDPNSLYVASADVGVHSKFAYRSLRCYVSRNSDSSIFISNSARHFVLYILFLALVGAMANALMNQYVLIDEKARRQLEHLDERERYNTSIANDMNDLLVTLDTDMRIVSINPATCAVLGVKEEKVLGRNFHNIVHRGHDCINTLDCDAIRVVNDLKSQIASGMWSDDKYSRQEASWLIDSKGQTVNYEGRFSIMRRDNGEFNIIAVFTNIDAEVKLRSIRSEYVAKLSHDMRTPLSCIKGSIDMFSLFTSKMVNDQGFTAAGSNMLEVARRNVDKMQQLINDVLLSDSIDNHTLHLETKLQAVAPIVQAAAEEQQEAADGLGVKLEIGICEGEAFVDELRLGQILQNLISNAIKYSPKGETVKIECRYDEGHENLLFSVRDNGKGIPRERHCVIFNRYSLSQHETVKKRVGLGLGLTICKGLVNAHGGEIWVDSGEGKGSTFYFTIPIRKQEAGVKKAVGLVQSTVITDISAEAK